MAPERKPGHTALTAAMASCLLLFTLAGGLYFTRYLQNRIFEERTTQLNEITAQVQVNLSNALDAHWNYLTAAVNLLESGAPETEEDAVSCIAVLEGLLGMEEYSSKLMLLDSRGNCYDAEGQHGVWADIGQLSGGEERYTFIADSYVHQGSYWTFVQKLEEPLQAGDVSFTHAVLLKDVYTLSEYYDSAAYGNRSETYILKSNGTRMHDGITQGGTIQAYNVLKVLEEMEGQKIPDIRAELARLGTISTNFQYNGTEYYYCLTSLEEYDTLLLFLIPASFVASGTVRMVGTVIRTLLALSVVLVVLLVDRLGESLRKH